MLRRINGYEKGARRILVVLADRANYGRMKMVMESIRARPELELLVMCAGSMVLERFGNTVQEVRDDGFSVDSKVFMELEGSIPLSMAKFLGFGVIEFTSEINRLQLDIVLLIGDRYEALAAAYMNIPIAHIQGGEISGSIDESARHAITIFQRPSVQPSSFITWGNPRLSAKNNSSNNWKNLSTMS